MPEGVRTSFDQDSYEQALTELYEVLENRPRMLYGITHIPARQVLADNAAYIAAFNQRETTPSGKDVSPDGSANDVL
ncbi:hypothetical protein GCM10029978_102520 [Actinoallomurus acanthiterrae]